MKETAALRTPFTTEHAAWEWFAIKPGGGLQRRWTCWCLVLDLAWTRRNQSGFCFAFMCLICLSKMHRMWNIFHIHNLPVLLAGGFQGLLACVHEGCLLWISSLHPKSWLVSTSSFTTSMLAKDKLYFFSGNFNRIDKKSFVADYTLLFTFFYLMQIIFFNCYKDINFLAFWGDLCLNSILQGGFIFHHLSNLLALPILLEHSTLLLISVR